MSNSLTNLSSLLENLETHLVHPGRNYMTYKRFSHLQKEECQLGLGEGCNILDLMTVWQETCSLVTVIIVCVVL